MAEVKQDDSVLFKTNILGLDLEYTKTDAAIDGTLVAGGALIGGVGAAPAAGIAVVRSGAMMLGRGILKAVFKSAAKEGAEVVAKTAAKATAETAVKTSVKTGLKEANEDALAALVKAKAVGEAERAGVKAVASEVAGSTAAKAGVEAAADVAAKTVAKEAVESTSKKLLGAAATAGSYAWTGLKTASFPFRHPILTFSGLGAAHVVTGGASSDLVWDGAIGTWNATKEYAPAVASTVAEGTLKVGDGFMGFLATGGKKGAEHLGDHLPPGIPRSIKTAMGSVGTKNEDGSTPSLKDRAGAAFEGAKDKAGDAAENAGDFLEGAQAQPFREMIGKFMGMDPNNVNGKTLTTALGQKAKENPSVALGMAFGAMAGITNSSSMAERAWKVPLYTAIWGIAFMLLGPILNPLLKGLGNWAGDKVNDYKESNGLKDPFHSAQVKPYANGALPSTAITPATAKTEAANDPVADFRSNSSLMTSPVTDVSKRGINPVVPAANRDQYALSMNG